MRSAYPKNKYGKHPGSFSWRIYRSYEKRLCRQQPQETNFRFNYVKF